MPSRCAETSELFNWVAPDPVERFDELEVQRATLRQRIAIGVAETLNDCPNNREEIAEKMSKLLVANGEKLITPNMLDAYASPSREGHSIPFLRLVALIHATKDTRLLQLVADMSGQVLIDQSLLSLIDFGRLALHQEDVRNKMADVRRDARIATQRPPRLTK